MNVQAWTTVAVCFIVYFIPYIVAESRGYKGVEHKSAIFVLNLFTGWTGIGWVGALIWALCSPPKRVLK